MGELKGGVSLVSVESAELGLLRYTLVTYDCPPKDCGQGGQGLSDVCD